MKRKRWLWIFLISAIVFAPMIYVVRFPAGLANDMAAIHRLGIATTNEEIVSRMPTQGANAADDYDKACVSLLGKGTKAEAYETLQKSDPYRSTGLSSSPLSKRDALASLDELKSTLDLCVIGSAKPRCVYKDMMTGADLGNTTYAAWYSPFTVTSVLYEAALVASDHGRVSDALRYLLAATRVVRQMSQDRQFYAMEAVTNNTEYIARTWLGLLPMCGHDRKLLGQWIEVGKEMPDPPEMKWMFSSNVVVAIQEYDEAIKDPDAYFSADWRMKSALVGTIYSKKPTVFYAKIQAVHTWKTMLESLPAGADQWETAEHALDKADDAMNNKWPVKKMFQSWFKSGPTVRSYVNNTAYARLMRTCAFLMDGWMRTSTFPSALPSGLDSTDPDSHKPFDYRSDGKSFQIYSSRLPAATGTTPPPSGPTLLVGFK